jgi:hypothetical protein
LRQSLWATHDAVNAATKFYEQRLLTPVVPHRVGQRLAAGNVLREKFDVGEAE